MTLSLAAIASLSGCSGGGSIPGAIPVKGKVVYKGQPVAGASVTFIGEGTAKTATGMTDDNGTFNLMTLDTEGAVPGNYRVVVSKTDVPPELTKEVSMDEAAANANKPTPEPKALLPARYSDPTRTPLKFEVKDGTANYDLELTDA